MKAAEPRGHIASTAAKQRKQWVVLRLLPQGPQPPGTVLPKVNMGLSCSFMSFWEHGPRHTQRNIFSVTVNLTKLTAKSNHHQP